MYSNVGVVSGRVVTQIYFYAMTLRDNKLSSEFISEILEQKFNQ